MVGVPVPVWLEVPVPVGVMVGDGDTPSMRHTRTVEVEFTHDPRYEKVKNWELHDSKILGDDARERTAPNWLATTIELSEEIASGAAMTSTWKHAVLTAGPFSNLYPHISSTTNSKAQQ